MSFIGAARSQPEPFRVRISFVQASLVVGTLLIIAAWIFVLFLDRQQQHPFFSGETLRRATSFLNDLAGTGAASTPTFLRPERWAQTARLAYETLAMSILATAIAATGALGTFMFGARNVMLGELAPRGGRLGRGWFFLVRGTWA